MASRQDTTTTRRVTGGGVDFHAAMAAASVSAFWERSDRPTVPLEPPHIWRWETMEPLIEAAIDATTMDNAERRVLVLNNPAHMHTDFAGASITLAVNLQVLMPGERARPHRHSMNALRFVLEGDGAVTIVDGKPCPMGPGDMILTPSWTWHEHVHEGVDRSVWVDVLDVPVHNYLDTGGVRARAGIRPSRLGAGPRLRRGGLRAVCANRRHALLPDVSLSVGNRYRGARGGTPWAGRIAQTSLHQSGDRSTRVGDHRLLSGGSRRGPRHQALSNQQQCGLCGGRGRWYVRRRRRNNHLGQERHLHAAPRALDQPPCKRAPTQSSSRSPTGKSSRGSKSCARSFGPDGVTITV